MKILKLTRSSWKRRKKQHDNWQRPATRPSQDGQKGGCGPHSGCTRQMTPIGWQVEG